MKNLTNSMIGIALLLSLVSTTSVLAADIPLTAEELLLVRPIITLTTLSNYQSPLPFGGGDVEFTYIVENKGLVPMYYIDVTNDKQIQVSLISGDVNRDHILDTDETWIYTSTRNIEVSTTTNAIAQGGANGYIVRSYDSTIVDVMVPGLPKTGLTEQSFATKWGATIILASIMISLFAIAGFTYRKRSI